MKRPEWLTDEVLSSALARAFPRYPRTNVDQMVALVGEVIKVCETTSEVPQKARPDFIAGYDAGMQDKEHSIMAEMLDPDMPAQTLRLHMGELDHHDAAITRAAIRWANSKVRVPAGFKPAPPAPALSEPVGTVNVSGPQLDVKWTDLDVAVRLDHGTPLYLAAPNQSPAPAAVDRAIEDIELFHEREPAPDAQGLSETTEQWEIRNVVRRLASQTLPENEAEPEATLRLSGFIKMARAALAASQSASSTTPKEVETPKVDFWPNSYAAGNEGQLG